MKSINTKPGFLKAKDIDLESFVIVHPLFDIPEEKIDTDTAPPLKMSKSVKWSLISLRAYLIIMIGLAFYRTAILAGII